MKEKSEKTYNLILFVLLMLVSRYICEERTSNVTKRITSTTNPMNNTANSANGNLSNSNNNSTFNITFDREFTCWRAMSLQLTFLIPPGIGLLYTGLGYSRDFVAVVALNLAVISIINILWSFFCFTLAFGTSVSGFIGDMKYIAYTNIDNNVSPDFDHEKIPSILFLTFTTFIVCIPNVILTGSIVGRWKYYSIILFCVIWTIMVITPIVHWTWNKDGFLKKLGYLDCSGGLFINVASGVSSLMLSILTDFYHKKQIKELNPKNISTFLLAFGTLQIWFGNLAFNSALYAKTEKQLILAIININFSVACGITFYLIYSFVKFKKPKIEFICYGVLCGVKCLNSGSGYIPLYSVLIINFVSSGIIFAVQEIRKINKTFTDNLDVFSINTICGCIGSIGTATFATKSIGGTSGAIENNWLLLGYHVSALVLTIIWSVIWTVIIFFLMYVTKSLAFQTSLDEDFQESAILILPVKVDAEVNFSKDEIELINYQTNQM